eukprot:748829-Amphidinium_carterae.1
MAAEVAAEQGEVQPVVRTAEHKAWGMMWQSKCEWILVRDTTLQEDVFRSAIWALMNRHPALRTRPADPISIFSAVQQAFSCFELLESAVPTAWTKRWPLKK